MPRHAAAPASELPTGHEMYPVVALGVTAVLAEESAALAGLRQEHHVRLGQTEQANAEGDEVRKHIDRLHYELDSTRTFLRNLSQGDKKQLETYLAKHLGDPGISQPEHRTLTDWLADGVNGATDGELFGLLHSHVGYVAEQQRDPRLQETIRERHTHFAKGVMEGVDQGYYSEHALQKLPQVFTTPVYVADVWSMNLHNLQGYFSGSYTLIAQASKSDIDKKSWHQTEQELNAVMEDTIPHEDNHILFGSWEETWLKEAVAEHDTQTYNDGRNYAMRPSLRGEADSGIYAVERELVATLCEEGMRNVSIGMVTRAHTSEGLDSNEWKALMNAWDKAWNTTDMYSRVTESIDRRTREHLTQHPDAGIEWANQAALRRVLSDLRNDRTIMKQTPVLASV